MPESSRRGLVITGNTRTDGREYVGTIRKGTASPPVVVLPLGGLTLPAVRSPQVSPKALVTTPGS